MEPQHPYDIVGKFRVDSKTLFDKAFDVTGDMNILAKMYHNQLLTSIIIDIKPFIFAETLKAIDRLKRMNMNGVIVNFTLLGIYAVFTYDQYRRLLNRISDGVDDGNIDKDNINLYQVVLICQRQKLVFACTNPLCFEKMQRYAKDCFNVEVTRDNNQITVNLYAESEKEFSTLYNKLYEYIDNKNDEKCFESLAEVKIKKEGGDLCREYNINMIPVGGSANLQDILKMIKTINDEDYKQSKLTINVNIGNVNNCNNVRGNVNINQNAYRPLTNDERVRAAQYWVHNNNPIAGELIGVYYDRYAAANVNPISHKVFGPLARKVLNREYVRGTHTRHW